MSHWKTQVESVTFSLVIISNEIYVVNEMDYNSIKSVFVIGVLFFKCEGENVQNYDSKSSVKNRISAIQMNN